MARGYFRRRGCTCKKKKCTCGAKWSFTIDLGRDPATGKRKQLTRSGFSTKEEAETAAAEVIVKLKQGTFKQPKKSTLSQYLQDWLETKKSTLSKSTFMQYQRIVTNHIIPALGNRELIKLSPADIAKFYSALMEEKRLAESTIGDIHKVLTAALNQAVKWDMIVKNPASLVQKPKAKKKELNTWTQDEAKRFLAVSKNYRTHIAFLLALTTGMRQGEILGLRWKDVDFEEGTIQVVQTLSHDGKELNPGAKTQTGNRRISVDSNTLHELKEHRKLILKEKMKQGAKYTDLDLVIPASNGKPLSPRNLLRTFYLIIEKADVPKITFHDLRHTHATLLLAKGVHPKVVAERLGHADMRVTLEVYSHVLPNIQKDAAEKFGKAFFQ